MSCQLDDPSETGATGFEPAISGVTGQRPLQTGPRTQNMVGEGFEPSSFRDGVTARCLTS